MKIEQKRINRREFVALSTAAGAAGLLSSIPGAAQAADFPSRKMQTYIPTRAGGGADRNFRAFSGVWSKHLGIEFEPGFFPGAAGRVGYETYMAKAADDCHDLIFGNMGPEVLNWVVKKPSFDLGAYQYIIQVDADPGSVFINTNSSMKTIDDVIAEGKKRTLTVATSRLAHPASLGMLVLAAKTGMKVNLIPLSGGKNTRNGVLTGETDLGVLPATTVMGRKNINILGLFDEKIVLPDRMPKAIAINTEYKLGLPPLAAGARAFGIKTSALEKHPDRYAKLIETAKMTFADTAYAEAVKKAKAPIEFISEGYADQCKAYFDDITTVGKEYKDLLTG